MLLSASIFYGSVVVAFVLAFGIGANDVANSFGTSVGSGALTLNRAVLIAAVCEFSGAVTLGAGVSDTIVRQISHLDEAACWNCNAPDSPGILLFMLGMACALLSGATFMLLATYFAMPVSTTHAIVGAVLGMTVAGAGAACVRWGYPGLVTIVASWFASPVLAGLLSATMHLAIQRGVFKAGDPFAVAMRALPFLYGASVGTVLSLVLLKAQPTQAWPGWLTTLVTIAVAVAVGVAVQLLLVPQLHRNISSWGNAGQVALSDWAPQVEAGSESKMSALPYEPGLHLDGSELTGLLQEDRQQRTTTDIGDIEYPATSSELSQRTAEVPTQGDDPADLSSPDNTPIEVDEHAEQQEAAGENPAAEQVFMYLQVLTACLKSFAHGANDTANAAGPFAAVQSLYLNTDTGCQGIGTPLWVLAFCGVGIVVVGFSQLACTAQQTCSTSSLVWPVYGIHTCMLLPPSNTISAEATRTYMQHVGQYRCQSQQACFSNDSKSWSMMQGLSTWGHRVMQTVGKDLVAINFSRGFAIELGSTFSVVLASVVGMPVSSTHCQIGSIVAVGIAETGLASVEWSVFYKIVISWLVTVPLAAVAAGVLFLVFHAVLHV